ncbi:hypothetical protein [Myroides sp. DF42-4-2]|uniref:hypothetical protein n=1 Tax=unclassified Myroides TaxID=2642485 RepID=UPI0025757596|nr:hypothetical protein [Myroides sp. DF42-4-2]MDM1406967.1 hypothetical protein [Myroides sp. DF42-4-2]
MNIIEIIMRNYYFKQLYPEGLQELAVVSFSTNLSYYTLRIRTSIKPAIAVEKWGRWLMDYDTVEIELSDSFIKAVNTFNWTNNTKKICQVKVQQLEGNWIQLRFFNEVDNWYLELVVSGLVFQRCRVYEKEEEDDYTE